MKKKLSDVKRGVLALLLFFYVPIMALAQVTNVTGKVTDEKGDPIPGVNILVEGTMQGTITNIDGVYNIEVPGDAQLKFNYIGFATQLIAVNNQTTINVTLIEDIARLDEVVVVGYGVQKKSDITGSITSVDVEKLNDVPVATVSRALQGKTAGVEIQNTSTRPGGDTQIRIRGNRSLTASNDPLIVIDGIPFGGSLNDISADNIESMEILKDASATVIYGSRGANGVIIISTKRGKEGDLNISYSGYYGVSTVARKYDTYNAEGFIALRAAAGYTNYLPVEKESMLLGRETNWQDLVYQNGHTVNQEITLSGGTEKTQYSFTSGYFDETGVLPEMSFNRYNMRFALDQKIGKSVRVGFTSMNSVSITEGESANPMWSLVTLSPLSVPYNADGSVYERPGYDTEETYSPLTLRDKDRWDENRRRVASFNSFYGEVQISNGLKYRLNAGIDFSDTKYNNFYGSNTPFKSGRENSASIENSDYFSYTIENMLSYDKTFAEDHRVSATAMYSVQESVSTSSRIDLNNIPVNYLQYHNIGSAESIIASDEGNYYTKWGLISFMGRINYVYKDKYMVTLTGRSDGSSRLAEGNKWHSYPALALGWNVINEDFMSGVDFISNLKIRAGYGQTSNASVAPYSTLGGLDNTFYSYGDEGVKGYYVSSLPNKDLGWEFTTTSNLGVDFGLFRGRLSGSVDVFKQETNDLLLGKRLPPSEGVPGAFIENIGKTENKGLEVVLNGIILDNRERDRLGWDVSANLFLYREKIVALQDPSIKEDVGNGWFVGHPSSAIYDYVKVGIWQLDEADEAATYGQVPGQIKFLDFAGGGENGDEPDGQINDADRRVIGSSQPDFQGGFTSNWTYKGFDLSVVGYFRVGGTIASTLHMPADYLNRLDGRRNSIKVDYWTPDNPTNDMPQPDVNIDAARSNVLGYFDGSFLKIRSINLGYKLKREHTRFLGEKSSVRVYASVTDPLILFSPYIDAGGVDPEPNGKAEDANDSVNIPDRTLVVGLNTPPTTRFIFGLNVKF